MDITNIVNYASYSARSRMMSENMFQMFTSPNLGSVPSENPGYAPVSISPPPSHLLQHPHPTNSPTLEACALRVYIKATVVHLG